MSITREEFDALVTRVNALEAVTERTWSMIGHLDTAVRDVDRRFDRRFDSLDHKFSERLDSVDRSLAEISRHLGMIE